MGKKNDKNGPKIDKNGAKIALFLYIYRVCFLKIFAGGGLGDSLQNRWPENALLDRKPCA